MPRENLKGSFLQDGRETGLHQYIFSQPRDSLEGNPKAILDAIHTYAKTKARMMIFQKHKLTVSREVLEKVEPKPKILVELGTYVGSSAVAWGAMLKDINGGSAKDVTVYSMELDERLVKISSDFVKLAGLYDTVKIIQGQSSDSLKRLQENGTLDKIDVLFVDHWEKFYLPDLQLCEDLGLFKKGTVIIADNTDIPGAPEYVKYVKSGGRAGKVKYETQTLVTTENNREPRVLEVTYVVEAN